MKGLAWYTAIVVGLMELAWLAFLIDGEETATMALFCLALLTPILVFAIKFLQKKK